MMPSFVKVEQLIVGYVTEEGGGCRAEGSVSLILHPEANILVDTGSPLNWNEVKEGLSKHNLSPDDVTHVVVTHGHTDHCANIGQFSNAVVYMDNDVLRKGVYMSFGKEEQIVPGIRILKLRGHTDNDLVVVVDNTPQGTLVVAGDLFESESDEDCWRSLSKYPQAHEESRSLLRKIADFIIPGHGAGFFVSGESAPTTTMAPRELLEGRIKGQESMLRYWDELTDEQKQNLAKQITSIDVQECQAAFRESANVYKPNPDNLKPIPHERHFVSTELAQEELERLTNLGLEAVSRGEVCALVLAGGQASRLGSSAPKGTIPLGIGAAEGDSLLAIQAAKIARLEEMAREKFPGTSGTIQWVVMTSGSTEQPTREHLEKVVPANGLDMSRVTVFSQANIPAFDMEGNLLLSDKGQICTAPNGNGGLYSALAEHLPRLKELGVKYFHVYCVDNILCRVADPAFIGMAIDKNADCAAKSVLKNSGELVGSITLDGESPRVTEYSELGAELAERVGSDGRLLFCAGNIANHLFTMEFLESFCTPMFHLPYHRALKKIAHINEAGELVKPEKPNGIKLEQFIFDVFPMSKNFYIWEVSRDDEFSPLKNAESAGKDCLSTCKRDLCNQSTRWLTEVGASVSGEVFVSPRKSYCGENLESLKGEKVTGVIH